MRKQFAVFVLLSLTINFLHSQDYSEVSFHKYQIESGRIVYQYYDKIYSRPEGEQINEELIVTFSKFGSHEVFEGSLVNQLGYLKIVKRDSLQTYYLLDSTSIDSVRKVDFLIEKYVASNESKLFQHLFLNKKDTDIFLYRKCELFHDYMFLEDGTFERSELDDSRGYIKYYGLVPLYVHIHDPWQKERPATVVFEAVEFDIDGEKTPYFYFGLWEILLAAVVLVIGLMIFLYFKRR